MKKILQVHGSALVLVALLQVLGAAANSRCRNLSCGLFKNISYPFGRLGSDHASSFGCDHPDFQIHCQSDEPFIEINSVEYKVVSLPTNNNDTHDGQMMMMRIGKIVEQQSVQDCRVSLDRMMNNQPNLTGSPFQFVDNSLCLISCTDECPNSCRLKNGLASAFSGDGKCRQQTPPTLVFEVRWKPPSRGYRICYSCMFVRRQMNNKSTPTESKYLTEMYIKYSASAPAEQVSNKASTGKSAPAPTEEVSNKASRGKSVKSMLTSTGKSAPAPAEEVSNKASRGKSVKSMLRGLAIGCSISLAVAVTLLAMRCRSRRAKQGLNHDGADSARDGSTLIPRTLSLPYFTYEELELATDNFNAKREIGDGGFASVYLGKLKDGRLVAVKKLYRDNSRRMEQFGNEVRILSSLNHRNLVLLVGYCEEKRELLLVYEYVANGPLAEHLHGDRAFDKYLPWDKRLNIALQTAEGLAYLHFSVKPPIFHRDITSNNILLDNDFNAKIADFGLSRLVPEECMSKSKSKTKTKIDVFSTGPQGTPGYMDPDYHMFLRFSDKSDVYSFGVVLMELISARKALDISRDNKEVTLANLALCKIQSGALHEFVDPALQLDWNDEFGVAKKAIMDVAELAFSCLAPEKDDRPNMMEVVLQLKRIKHNGYPQPSQNYSVLALQIT